jgi:hypothetical protein
MAGQMVRIYNDHTKDHVENFEGDTVRIPAKGHVVMERLKACAFMGQFWPIQRDGMGKDLTPKMLRMEMTTPEAENEPSFKCMMCSEEFKSASLLKAHSIVAHEEAMVDEEAKPKRGRPRKEG